MSKMYEGEWPQSWQRSAASLHGAVFVGNEVVSAERSRAALQLGRDISLHLGANARVRIDRFVVDAVVPYLGGREDPNMQSTAQS